jgi:NarL family two-component system sensor histidine kinase LiaS
MDRTITSEYHSPRKWRLRQPFRRLASFFHRLQWKLTLAYTLFTVVTILFLVATAVGFLWYFNFYSQGMPVRLAEGLQRAAPSIALYFSPVDEQGLASWVDSVMHGSDLVIPIPREAAGDSADTIPAQFGRVKLLAILDPAGKVLASYPPNVMPIEGNFRTTLSPAVITRLDAALSGSADTNELATRDAEGNMVAAVPIIAGDNSQPAGAILLISKLWFDQIEFVELLLRGTILPAATAMLVVGIIAGLLFGYIISRGLTGRLKKLTQTTDKWSQGDFSTLAYDPSGDELGQLARHLNHMAIQLQNLLQTRQELATLEERNRLARDLHDSVKQQVFATAMQIGAAKTLIEEDPNAVSPHLLEAEHLIRQSQQELTSLIKELRPAALEGQGLAHALQDYTTNWSRRTHIPVEVRIRGERPLPLSLEQTLYRVAQESLSNVARHSNATGAEIELAWEDDGLLLAIRDNGQGFDVAASNGHGMGLKSMSERMAAIGGFLVVESTPQQGTRITARVPNIS